MRHLLVIRCEHGHETRVLHDERYSRDVVRAFGNFLCGGEAIGITGDDGEPIRWADQPCGVVDEIAGNEHAQVGRTCGGALGFTIEEV